MENIAADRFSQFMMAYFVGPAHEILLPLMLTAFFTGVITRVLMYYSVRSQQKFTKEFEKRVHRYLRLPVHERNPSFFRALKLLLDQTYKESFEMRARYKRRNMDHAQTLADRIFLIEAGAQRLVRDTLHGAKYFRKEGAQPRILDLVKGVFDVNPVFNRVLGIFPTGMLHDFLGILPGLFVIGGIFGTFLGIIEGLPGLGQMDVGNVEASKKLMDAFLSRTSFSMIASIVGIFLSVCMTLINTFFAVDGMFFNLVNRFSGSIETLWNESQTNEWTDRETGEDHEQLARSDRRQRTLTPPPMNSATHATAETHHTEDGPTKKIA